MIDPSGRVYGVIQNRRRGGETIYRAERDGAVLGWANSLKLAAYRVHMVTSRRWAVPRTAALRKLPGEALRHVPDRVRGGDEYLRATHSGADLMDEC